jgi:hypothetical protein
MGKRKCVRLQISAWDQAIRAFALDGCGEGARASDSPNIPARCGELSQA